MLPKAIERIVLQRKYLRYWQFINCATAAGFLSKQMLVGKKMKSCTMDIGEVTTTIDGIKCCFIDTPGFEDTRQSDVDILRKVSNWLEVT